MIERILVISLSAILVENFVLVQFLGICPFLGVSKSVGAALGMGVAVTFVMTIASALTWAVQQYILLPFDIEYLRTIAFVLLIATLVQIIEMFLQKVLPALHATLGIYLPLITTNCAVLGVTLVNLKRSYGLGESVLYGFMSAVGFSLAIVLMAGVRERLEHSEVPKFMKGVPITLISAGLLALAFLGFSGLRL